MTPVLALLAAAQMYGQMMPPVRTPSRPAATAHPTPAPTPTPTPSPAPLPTAAVATPEQQDERCLAAFAYLAGREGEAGQAGRTGAMFFYGKLVGRDASVDLAGALRTAAGAIADRIQPELIRCSGELQAAGQAMHVVGQALAGVPAPSNTPTPQR